MIPFDREEEVKIKIELALQLCLELIETSPYLCLCGAGITTPLDCEWHMALDEASVALSEVGYTPSWMKEENDNGDTDETVENAGTAGSSGSGPFGTKGTLPNCS